MTNIIQKFIYMNVCMSYKMLQYDRIDISEGIDINKTDASKECIIVINVIWKRFAINLSNTFVMVVVTN